VLILCGVAPGQVESGRRADVLFQETAVKAITEVELFEIVDSGEPYRIYVVSAAGVRRPRLQIKAYSFRIHGRSV